MSDKLILNNGDIINISEFSNLSNIIVECGCSDVSILFSRLTTDNLSHIQFKDSNDNLMGEYHNMKLETGTYKIIDSNVDILISLREKTELEKKIDEIELNQKNQGEAIKELQEKVTTPV